MIDYIRPKKAEETELYANKSLVSYSDNLIKNFKIISTFIKNML